MYVPFIVFLIAAQMWLLGRVIPYLIGGSVPEGDVNWKNYLQLLEIVDLLLAPEISEDEVGELGILISQHLPCSRNSIQVLVCYPSIILWCICPVLS